MMPPERLPQRIWSPALSHSIAKPLIAVVMGVSGSGKTTVAVLLSAALGCQFQEGDDLHPAANVQKMHSGTPFTGCLGSARSRTRSTAGARGASPEFSPVRPSSAPIAISS